MDSRAKTVVVGFDPGVANLGVAVFYWAGDKPHYAESCTFRLGAKSDDFAAIADRLVGLFDRLEKDHGITADNALVAIEQQTYSSNPRVLAVEFGLHVCAGSRRWRSLPVSPLSVKKKSGLGCHGYADNKKRALDFVGRQLGYPVHRVDEADAVLVALYGTGIAETAAVYAPPDQAELVPLAEPGFPAYDKE